MNAAQASGVPEECHGFELYPIGIPQYGRFENWMKQQAVNQGRESIRGQGLAQVEMDTIMGQAFDSRQHLTFGSPVGYSHMHSIEGMTYLIWLSCQKGKPELELEDIDSSLSDFTDIQQIQEVMNTILRISSLAKTKEGGLKQKKSSQDNQ